VSRLDRLAAAERLGVTPRTLQTYIARRLPGMPAFVEVGGVSTVDEGEWVAWIASRPGPGKPKGATAHGSPCQKCGLMVERRWRDQRTGLLLCKPDHRHVGDLSDAELPGWLAEVAMAQFNAGAITTEELVDKMAELGVEVELPTSE
jgi:hypothetical protein